ncbi:terminase small subunit [uncultured Flavobacterium sp.]|uniref:terminase small subunit n=1 Tax=uncultured Flavobacterium sp. TaxID=165435 RepID=UPI0030EB4637|tara:strand:+ start:24692 stop:25267 length:576 start_codon:yes stop_codon:yes gene_type:complete
MKTSNLTIKQEAFCQAYIRLGDKSAAYREAYSTSKMKPESIHVKAVHLSNEVKISTRIEFLRSQIQEDNKVTISEIVNTLSDMLRFDISELYDSNGNLKNIHSIPKKARIMIAQLETDEINIKGQTIGHTKKLKVFDKLQAVEKLMKHLGGYESDNKQKASLTIDTDGFSEEKQKRLDALKAKLLLIENKE